MEIKYEGSRISFEKEFTLLDELAVSFSQVLQGYEIDHVFVGGYIAILFGRSRVSEDIDVLVREISIDRFLSLWDELDDYYCHNTPDPSEAYEEYLEKGIAIRFSKVDVVIPNIEFKFANTGQQRDVLDDLIMVELNGETLPIASIESQISYKLYMASEKDIEDAKYLFEIFEKEIDMESLNKDLRRLGVPVSSVDVLSSDILSGDEIG